MTHTKPCKFCGIPVAVESDPDFPPEWADVLLKLLSCNRCADYRSRMGRMGAEIRKICLNTIQTSNDESKAKSRKLLEGMTWKVAETTCKFYRVRNTIYSQDFVDQLMENPDKSSLILKTYAGMVRNEARQQRQQHEQRIEPATEPETILHGSGGEDRVCAQDGLPEHAPGPVAVAAPETNQPAGGAGQNKSGGLPEQTVLI